MGKILAFVAIVLVSIICAGAVLVKNRIKKALKEAQTAKAQAGQAKADAQRAIAALKLDNAKAQARKEAELSSARADKVVAEKREQAARAQADINAAQAELNAWNNGSREKDLQEIKREYNSIFARLQHNVAPAPTPSGSTTGGDMPEEESQSKPGHASTTKETASEEVAIPKDLADALASVIKAGQKKMEE